MFAIVKNSKHKKLINITRCFEKNPITINFPYNSLFGTQFVGLVHLWKICAFLYPVKPLYSIVCRYTSVTIIVKLKTAELPELSIA
jgi:hypothetical protein